MENDIVYGPVASWRLGRSLGVDIICGKNICTFNCIYCQLGPSEEKTDNRRVFVDTDKIIKAVSEALARVKNETDVITLSGTGEPTLAANIGEVIDSLHQLADIPVAVLTNCSLLFREDVRQELARVDIVVGSLDAGSEQTWRIINRPLAGLKFERLIEGMKKFRQSYDGYFSLEVMLTDANRADVPKIVAYAGEIEPDEIQVNTPLRESGAEALTAEEIEAAAVLFRAAGFKVRCVYQEDIPEVATLLGEKKLLHIKRPEG
ncbi:MAG: radical SAM protein [bacterium]